MLEQSFQDGTIYFSRETVEDNKAKLISKVADKTAISFGPPAKIIIHTNPRTDAIMVELPGEAPNGYVYQNGELITRVKPVTRADDQLQVYNWGAAIFKDRDQEYQTGYLIVDDPKVTIEETLEPDQFQIPTVIAGYPYQQTFTYDKGLISLLGDKPATFTDRYKRPLSLKGFQQKRYYPVALDKVTSTFAALSMSETHFPLVVLINPNEQPAHFAVVDLEPTYTPEDLALAESFQAYYVEDTPRGGKHYLVKVNDSPAMKYRLTDNIEVQIHAQITLYGINGKMLLPDPEPSDFSEYQVVGHDETLPAKMSAPENISSIVDDLKKINDKLDTSGRINAKRNYILDDNPSHADFMAMLTLYREDIKPVQDNYDLDDLPWIVAEYAARVIPPRAKHQTMRSGVPYLVYVANKFIHGGSRHA